MLIPALLGLVLASGAPQPPSAASMEPEWSVPEVVVRAASPRLWKLTSGQSTVWVLGIIDPLEKGLTWNETLVSHALSKSSTLLLPAEGSIGVFTALKMAGQLGLAHNKTLSDVVPSALYVELQDTLRKLGRDPEAYRHYKPVWAAFMLHMEVMKYAGLTSTEPEDSVRRLARVSRLAVTRIASYKMGSAVGQLLDLPLDDAVATLQDSVDGVNFMINHQALASRAWAKGDLRALRENIIPASATISVLDHTQAYKALEERSVNDTVVSLKVALGRPGQTFALLSLPSLARKGGVIDRVRADGIHVDEPSP